MRNTHLTKFRTLMIALTFVVASSCSSNAQDRTAANTAGAPAAKGMVLIVYLTRTGNTEAVAGMIRENVGGTMVALELDKPYPENYQATVDQVARENENGFLPPLKSKIENIEKYSTIFLGFPTWGMQLPPPMKSFLQQYDLKGKTIVPFNTNAGYGEGSSFRTVRELCPNSTVLDGFVTRGGIERDGVILAIKDARSEEVKAEVKSWLQRIKIAQ